MSWAVRSGGISDTEALLALWRAAGAEATVTDDAESIQSLLLRDPAAS